MKIRVLSDVHEDISDKPALSLAPADEALTLFCGDVANNLEEGIAWLEKNIKQGFIVAGNHDSLYGKRPIEDVHAALRERFPKEGDVVFLENDHKVIGDTVFVGATLWTDFTAKRENQMSLNKTPKTTLLEHMKGVIKNLFQRNAQKEMPDAARSINDFRLGLTRRRNGIINTFTPDDATKRNHDSLRYIAKICRLYPDKKIVVLTHHAPSLESVPEGEQKIEAAYANDLKRFIIKNNNIRLWCHGHVHEPSDYTIGRCRVISNPRGYDCAMARAENEVIAEMNLQTLRRLNEHFNPEKTIEFPVLDKNGRPISAQAAMQGSKLFNSPEKKAFFEKTGNMLQLLHSCGIHIPKKQKLEQNTKISSLPLSRHTSSR